MARAFQSWRRIQPSIRLCAVAIASPREPLVCETEGSALAGNEISSVHSFRPRPARMSKLIPSWVMVDSPTSASGCAPSLFCWLGLLGDFIRRLFCQPPRFQARSLGALGIALCLVFGHGLGAFGYALF